MSQKKGKKYDWSKTYDFDINKWYIEKEQVKQLRSNPTAIIYCRVSDIKQVTDGNWLESQESKCRRWAEENWVTILQVFKDWWVSWAIMKRKWLEEAITYLQQQNSSTKKVSYFLCTELSRISRSESIDETWVMKKRIESTWVEIYLTSTWMNISLKWASNELNTDLQVLIAKNERLIIKERSENWTKSKLYSWERTLPVPAWYERISKRIDWRKRNEIVKTEPQASIIKEWLELFANWVIENQSRLLDFFNNKKLVTNSYAAKPWKITSSFVSRLFEYEKLYFYTWQIFCPNYWIMSPIHANHEPLIEVSTMGKILDRLWEKGEKKTWIRKDISEKYPLRWILCCPICWHPMTASASKWKMWVYYDYFSCKRKECPNKENLRVDEVHADYVVLLQQMKPKERMIKLINEAVNESIKSKNKNLDILAKRDLEELKKIKEEIESTSDKIWKLTNPKLISELEKHRWELEDEKERLEQKITDYKLSLKDTNIIIDRIKTMLTDPVNIWKHFPVAVKRLHAWILFWWKLFYKKNEGFRTPHSSRLELTYNHMWTLNSPFGAGDGARTRNSLLGRQEL